MGELALYRKYRSADFSEVIGQTHIVRALTAALSSGRIRHAYLLTGPRGVGKTSVARLLARALNCTGEPKPCNKCQNCLTALGASPDVIEMDAASNRSIDSIRDLREKVNLAPTSGKYKIYIIDEVHMLTTEAFNALLKTLEEPPAHAIFILATTEAHKLPETIISRTQVFSFSAISEKDLVARLGDIAEREKIEAEPEALRLIASVARGGFRDAISLLDQMAGSSPKITATDVRELLGYTAAEEIAALARALAASDTAAALSVTSRLEAAGAQAGLVATQLAELWRAALLAGAGAAPAADPVAAELAKTTPARRIAGIISALIEVTKSPWPQLALEATVATLTSPEAPAEVSAPAPRPVKTVKAEAPVKA
ncbi:MAG TPA: DNA polymerase III subunit gamma/tau, partial [Candidatus Saccharimonadia bacterium]|nr:DNA polymerase III subunit gamma/tau [Candidatus Saccharimonadia bacterium]